ncbi:MAG: hypothetical protein IJ769_02945 [Clostridia bacterium]|nr:hypothetical protein [Clostridia bacterium]
MASKQSSKASSKWQANNVDRIVVKPRKRERLAERIQIAVDRGLAKSRQAYILNAVMARLEADGIPKVEQNEIQNSDE